jgi:hypothetical protein
MPIPESSPGVRSEPSAWGLRDGLSAGADSQALVAATDFFFAGLAD